MLCGSDVDGALRPIELSSGFEEIKIPSDGRGTGNAASFLIVLAPQPGPKAGAAERPGFPVPIDHDVCEGGAASRVEQWRIDIQIGQHIERHYAWALVLAPSNRSAVANAVGPVTGSRRVARSFR